VFVNCRNVTVRGVSFVDALALRLLSETAADPLALSNYTILLPTRRARRALSDAFLRQSDGRPLLLPRIVPLGDLDPDEFGIDEVDLVFLGGPEPDGLRVLYAGDGLSSEQLLGDEPLDPLRFRLRGDLKSRRAPSVRAEGQHTDRLMK
jgi:hypothetical protein